MRVIRSLLVIALLAGLSAGCVPYLPHRITGSELSGRVVDSGTGAAVSAVNIVAVWELERGTLGGQVPGGPFQVLETRSGADGRYRFAAWSKWLSCGTCVVSDRAAPLLFAFKPGYEPAKFNNGVWPATAVAPISFHSGGTYRSEWDGKDLPLTPAADAQSNAHLVRVRSFGNTVRLSAGKKGWQDMADEIERVTGFPVTPRPQGR